MRPSLRHHQHRCHQILLVYNSPRYIGVYNLLPWPYFYQICLSEMVVQGFNNPGAISSSTPKERKFESG
jgi:hypothetical protein